MIWRGAFKDESDGKKSYRGVGGSREPFQLPNLGKPLVNFALE